MQWRIASLRIFFLVLPILVKWNDQSIQRLQWLKTCPGIGKIEIYSVVAALGTADHMDYRKDMESQAAHWSHLLRGERAGHRRLALLLFLGASLFGGLSLYPALASLGGVSLWTAWASLVWPTESRCKRLCASKAAELVKPASHWGIEQMYGRKWTWVWRCWKEKH